ncbi:MAG: GTPase HflX [Candidatus Eisenbacteria bacterium]|nr:GTPase HflX [Candidatus Latescibacterota bacterium]MBD3302396.1 GTPase HflX [Candidatus Eisenbacteria bacterium]
MRTGRGLPRPVRLALRAGRPGRARTCGRIGGETQSRRNTKIARTPQSTEPKPERVVLVGLDSDASPEESLDELALLVRTAGGEVVGRIIQRRASIDPATFLSRGKRDQAREELMLREAQTLVFDEDLSPAQARNLEKSLKTRVIDRSELILDIFAKRARTREAMLQVELAQLEYMLPRLTKLWEHFGRLGGGIGTRGPGETQLEVDRRRVRQRISMLKRKLVGIDREREVQQKGRRGYFRAALVGYTNAGKSTLFNALTRAEVPAEDKLFATLDTTTRQVALPGGRRMLLSDTVGFIRKLPHHLVASFRATLMEVREADLIVHIVDASHPRYEEQMRTVDEVLTGLLDRAIPRLIVLNKQDQVADETLAHAMRARHPDAVLLSALDPEDVARLAERLGSEVAAIQSPVRVVFPTTRMGEVRQAIRGGRTVNESHLEGLVYGEYRLTPQEIDRLRKRGFEVQSIFE